MEKYFQGVLILASVLFVLYREALVVERLRRLPRMQEVVSSNPTEGNICFSQFTLFYRVECKKLFCKTNLKLKVLKLIKTVFRFIAYNSQLQQLLYYCSNIQYSVVHSFILLFTTVKTRQFRQRPFLMSHLQTFVMRLMTEIEGAICVPLLPSHLMSKFDCTHKSSYSNNQ